MPFAFLKDPTLRFAPPSDFRPTIRLLRGVRPGFAVGLNGSLCFSNLALSRKNEKWTLNRIGSYLDYPLPLSTMVFQGPDCPTRIWICNMDRRIKGTLTSWNDEKGFGFIAPSAGGKHVFVHIKAFSNRNRRPEINQLITYALSTDKHGRPCAVKATLAGDRLPRETKRKKSLLSVVGAACFFVLVGVTVVTSKIPPLILAAYVVVSLLTFVMYAVDKSAAKNGARRTPESTLHLLSLAGGWPGALVAQQTLRHKSKKQSFRAVFWVTVLLNGGAFVWLLITPAGVVTLRSLIAHLV